MSETTVNTSVARASEADWRFLLPVGADRLDHLVLMGGSPDLEATLVELGVARRITRTPRHAVSLPHGRVTGRADDRALGGRSAFADRPGAAHGSAACARRASQWALGVRAVLCDHSRAR